MRVNSALHRRLPTAYFAFDIYLRELISKKRGKLSLRLVNNQAYFAATAYWRSKPFASFGAWEGDGDAWFQGTTRRMVEL